MASGKKQPTGKNQLSREARERARIYKARTEFHSGQSRRRIRDNWIAGIAATAIIAGAVVSQVAAYSSGPWAPAPTPTTSIPAPAPTPAPTDVPDLVPTPATTP